MITKVAKKNTINPTGIWVPRLTFWGGIRNGDLMN
jgi:hypothetical protein